MELSLWEHLKGLEYRREEDFEWLKELATKHPKVKALGEMGLDFYKELASSLGAKFRGRVYEVVG